MALPVWVKSSHQVFARRTKASPRLGIVSSFCEIDGQIGPAGVPCSFSIALPVGREKALELTSILVHSALQRQKDTARIWFVGGHDDELFT